MKKLLLVFVGSLIFGIGAGLAMFYLIHSQIPENFVPYNMGAESDEVLPSAAQ